MSMCIGCVNRTSSTRCAASDKRASFLGENLVVHTDNPGIPGNLWGWGVWSFVALLRARGGARAWPYARGDDPLVTHPRLDAAFRPHDAAVPQ